VLDPQVIGLLETSIDTSCKLAVALKYLDHRGLNATPSEMALRVCRDIWSVEAALNELAADGVLVRREPRFALNPAPEVSARLALLADTYTHPLKRDELHHLLRDLETYAPYRSEARARRRKSMAA
jgi:hypothetical protein